MVQSTQERQKMHRNFRNIVVLDEAINGVRVSQYVRQETGIAIEETAFGVLEMEDQHSYGGDVAIDGDGEVVVPFLCAVLILGI